MAIVPNTQGRLVTSVNLKASVLKKSVDSRSTNLPVTTQDIASIPQRRIVTDNKNTRSSFANAVTIGRLLDATSSITISQNRTNTRIYALGASAFEPFQIVPGPVTTDLELSRVVLYARDFFEALGFTHGTLTSQIIPFLIDIELRAPTGALRTIRIHDCWLTSHNLPFDISGNSALIVQNLRVTAGKIETQDATFGAIGSITQKAASYIKLPSRGA